MSGPHDVTVEAASFQDRECYNRRLGRRSWADIGFALWPELRRGRERDREEAILKASCAASRHANRAGLPWPISTSRRSGLLE